MRLTVRLIVLMVCLWISAFHLSGCGRSNRLNNEVRTTTLGQELQDLDDAYKRGLLTDAEYEKQRTRLLKRR